MFHFLATPNSSIFNMFLLYNVGSVHDPGGKEGLAHFVEHLMFRKDKKLVEDLFKLGVWNAMTTKDITMFFIEAHSSNFEKVIEMMHMISLRPKLCEADLDEEREIVRKEIDFRMFENVPRDHILFNISHKDVYSQSVIGTTRSLKSINVKDVNQHYNKHYKIPIILVQAHKSIKERTRHKIADLFETYNLQPRPMPLMHVHLQTKPFLNTHMSMNHSNNIHIMIGFHLPPHDMQLVNTVELMQYVMSRELTKTMRFQKKVTYTVRSDYLWYQSTGILHMSIVVPLKKLDDTKLYIFTLFERLIYDADNLYHTYIESFKLQRMTRKHADRMKLVSCFAYHGDKATEQISNAIERTPSLKEFKIFLDDYISAKNYTMLLTRDHWD